MHLLKLLQKLLNPKFVGFLLAVHFFFDVFFCDFEFLLVLAFDFLQVKIEMLRDLAELWVVLRELEAEEFEV